MVMIVGNHRAGASDRTCYSQRRRRQSKCVLSINVKSAQYPPNITIIMKNNGSDNHFCAVRGNKGANRLSFGNGGCYKLSAGGSIGRIGIRCVSNLRTNLAIDDPAQTSTTAIRITAAIWPGKK